LELCVDDETALVGARRLEPHVGALAEYVTVVTADGRKAPPGAGHPTTDQTSPAIGVLPKAAGKGPLISVPVAHALMPQAGMPAWIAQANEYAKPAPSCSTLMGAIPATGIEYDVPGTPPARPGGLRSGGSSCSVNVPLAAADGVKFGAQATALTVVPVVVMLATGAAFPATALRVALVLHELAVAPQAGALPSRVRHTHAVLLSTPKLKGGTTASYVPGAPEAGAAGKAGVVSDPGAGRSTVKFAKATGESAQVDAEEMARMVSAVLIWIPALYMGLACVGFVLSVV
jgi:hypothetical protein